MNPIALCTTPGPLTTRGPSATDQRFESSEDDLGVGALHRSAASSSGAHGAERSHIPTSQSVAAVIVLAAGKRGQCKEWTRTYCRVRVRQSAPSSVCVEMQIRIINAEPGPGELLASIRLHARQLAAASLNQQYNGSTGNSTQRRYPW